MFTDLECHTHSFPLLLPLLPRVLTLFQEKQFTMKTAREEWYVGWGLSVCSGQWASLSTSAHHWVVSGLIVCWFIVCKPCLTYSKYYIHFLRLTCTNTAQVRWVSSLSLPAHTAGYFRQTNNCMETIRDNLTSQYFITLTLYWQEVIILNLWSTPC